MTDTSIQVSDSDKIKEEFALAEFKRTSFDREVKALFRQCKETILARYKVSIDLGEEKPELIYLERYSKIYNGMQPEEHYSYFELLYNRNRLAILNCLKDDRWIRTGRLFIQFGEGIKKIEARSKDIKIPVSDIFLIACDLQSIAEKSLEGIGDEFLKQSGGKDLIRPQIILLHLTRIFYYLNDGNDKKMLGEIVNQLENDLGITKRTLSEQLPVKKETPSESGTSSGISGLFNLAKDMMEKMGVKPPENMKAPSDSDVTGVIKNVFENPATKNLLTGIINSVQSVNGAQDINTAMQGIIQNVSNPETLKSLSETVERSIVKPEQKPE